MNRCAQALAAFGLAALIAPVAPAHAQVARNFPANALRGELFVHAGADVRLNGQPARLAPGARIRDANNFLVMSGSVAGSTYTVHYTLESNGLLLDVWLLRPEEKARQPWPTTEAQARSWVFDPVGQTWTRK